MRVLQQWAENGGRSSPEEGNVATASIGHCAIPDRTGQCQQATAGCAADGRVTDSNAAVGSRLETEQIFKGLLTSEPYWLRSLPHPAWLRLFHRQLDRDAAAQAAGHAFFFAAEKLGGGNYYGSAPSRRAFIVDFYADCMAAAAVTAVGAGTGTGLLKVDDNNEGVRRHMNNTATAQLFLYEQIPSWLPCKLYFDVGAWSAGVLLTAAQPPPSL